MSSQGALAVLCGVLLVASSSSLSQQPAVEKLSVKDPRVKAATAAKDRHSDFLFSLPAVVGAGIGVSEDDPEEVAIQVFVSRELKDSERRKFPKKLEGVPVEIRVSGEFQALPAASEKRPARPGGRDRKSGKERPEEPRKAREK